MILHYLPPEFAHRIGHWAMRYSLLSPGKVSKPVSFFDTELLNPLGLAAGFDKAAKLPPTIQDYGFGWVEVGSVTYYGGRGSRKPRLFRIGHTHLLNRMGLNGEPAATIANRIHEYDPKTFSVNIAKTNRRITGWAGIDDICASYRCLSTFGLYTVINLSCPNTEEGITFQEPEMLGSLLKELTRFRLPESRPLFMKLGPEIEWAKLDQIITICENRGVDGFVSCNTKPYTDERHGRGGLSGPQLFDNNRFQIQHLAYKHPVIACGGITTPDCLEAYLRDGAVAAQAFTGFVVGPFSGPKFAHTMLRSQNEDLSVRAQA